MDGLMEKNVAKMFRMPVKAVWVREFFDIKHRYVRPVLGWVLLAGSAVRGLSGNRSAALRHALAAHRLLYSPAALRACVRHLGALKTHGDQLVSDDVSEREAVIRSIVIRWPTMDVSQVLERGILVITFTKVASFYYRNIDIDALTRYFHIVVEPSWSGYMDADILFWIEKTAEPVFVQSSELRDRVALNCLCSNLVPISVGASDWVDYRNFAALDCDKVYDSIYVANTSPVKRVHVYLKAIKRIVDAFDSNYKGVLVCAAWGGKAAELQQLIDYYGVGANCELRLSLSQQELRDLLGRCKVNILLSLKEGSNRSLFESMFCNIPVVALEDNIGVNKSYINEYTGVLAYECYLPEVLLHMAANWRRYKPREWALQNISPEVTTEKVVSIIEARNSLDPGDRVGRIFAKTNNPEVSYLAYPSLERSDITENLLSIFSRKRSADPDGTVLQRELAQCKERFMSRIAVIEGAAS